MRFPEDAFGPAEFNGRFVQKSRSAFYYALRDGIGTMRRD